MALDWQRDQTRSARQVASRAALDDVDYAAALVARYHAPSKADLRAQADAAYQDWSRRRMPSSVHDRDRGPPMTLENMRENGVHSLWVACRSCRHEASVNVDQLPGEVEVPSAGRFFRCSKCGSKEINTRPNWTTQNPKPSGTGQGRRA